MTSVKDPRDTRPAMNFVIIGSSRGLGYALTSELVRKKEKKVNIVAVSRKSNGEVLHKSEHVPLSPSIRYEEIDVRHEHSAESFRKIAESLDPGPINVIYNSAVVQTDKNNGDLLNIAVAREIVDVGVVGLIRTLEGFETALLRHGGAFLGISSASALSYPIAGPLVTYPASKAFMDKMLQALAIVWPDHIQVLVIHLGRIGSTRESACGRFYHPTYVQTAKHILKVLESSSRSRSYTYPLVHAVAFRVLHHVFSFSWPVKLTKWLRRANTLNKRN